MIVQVFNQIAGLIIPLAIPTKETKAEMEKQPIIVQAKIRKC